MIHTAIKVTALIAAGVALTGLAVRYRTSGHTRWGERLCGIMVMIEGGATWLEDYALSVEWAHWLAVASGAVGVVLVCTRSSAGRQRGGRV